MKRTYTRTMMMTNEELQKTTIKLYISEYSKNDRIQAAVKIEVEYTGLTAWDIIQGGKEAEEIESETDRNSIDENHEYLVLHFNDGSTSTFRNSHVEMFIR